MKSLSTSEKKFRKTVSSCRTPVVDSKKARALMPPKFKSNKITFSDLETPKEVEKCPKLSSKMKQASGFSDLYTIAEEKTNKVDPRVVPQVSLDTKNRAESLINRKIHRSSRKNRVSLSLMANQKLSTKMKNPTSQEKSTTRFAPGNKRDSIDTESIKTDLDHQFVSLTMESKLPQRQMLTAEQDRATRQKYSTTLNKDGKGRKKSRRRNRKERMKSAHSQNRGSCTQNIPKANTFRMKESTSRVIPEGIGIHKNSFQRNNEPGKFRIRDVLRKIDLGEENPVNPTNTDRNEELQISHFGKYPFPKNQDHSSYGPLLIKNPPSGKSSFIEKKMVKLQVTQNDKDSQVEQRDGLNHIVSQESLGSTHLPISGLSWQNTTVSDKNSEQEKLPNKNQEETKNYSTQNFLDPSSAHNPKSHAALKRGRSADMRRGRASRNRDRIKKI